MLMELRIQLDDADLAKARLATGIVDPQELVRHAVREFVQLKATLELIRMGGSDPNFTLPPRWRPDQDPPPDMPKG